jgi:hypothetical protein
VISEPVDLMSGQGSREPVFGDSIGTSLTEGTVTASPRAAGATRPAGPLVCVTYATAGAAALQELVTSKLGFVCTQGTGLLPLCEKAASTWRAVEGSDRRLSELALVSIRATVSAMNSIVLASHGCARWCETAFVKAKVAQTFAEIFAGSRFLAFHRQCIDVIRVTAGTFPWGIAGTPLEEYGASPGGLVNAAAAYWLHWTRQLVELEQSLGDRVMRIRYEDVAEDPVGTASRIRAMTGMEGPAPDGAQLGGLVASLGSQAGQVAETLSAFRDVPLDQIPDGLAAEIDTLSRQLGYPILRESL